MRPIIDANVNLFRWPFRRVKWDDTAALLEKLDSHGVTRAWAGSFEGLLQGDITAVNARLVEECSKHPQLVPFGSINPASPGWEEDLRRCHEEYKMRGIRLHPNYHGYGLDLPEFGKLLRAAADRKLVVQLAVIMEDERTRHPLMQVPPVDVTLLPPLMKELPELRLILLNAFRTIRPEEAKRLAAAGGVYFDIAMLEGVGGIHNLLQQVPRDRVLFGSHAPLFYLESALLKLQESPLAGEELDAVCAGNASRLLA